MTDRAGPIRVIVVDDHEMLVESLVRLLRAEPDIEIVGKSYTATGAIELSTVERPDIVVIDYGLPDLDGASAAAQIIAARPDAKVLLLTGSGTDVAAVEAARAGCAGYLEKTRAIDELIYMIRDIHHGRVSHVDDELARLPRSDQLVVHYQPIVDLATSQTVGFEALVRWNHPALGLRPPDEFVPLAERTTAIIEIDERVRTIACRQAAEWNRERPSDSPIFVSVNLSGRELAQEDLTTKLMHTLDESGLDARALVVEVTETFLVDDAYGNARRLQELRAHEIRVALDDFGTAYSSLDYLRRFPVDIVKLDRTFTDGLPGSERSLRLVEAVGHLAASMGAAAHAEGIETAAQVACLRELQWPLGQGYYFSRPVPAGVAGQLIA